MAQPYFSQVHVDRVLSNVSVAYVQAAGQAYVADKVFPIVPVEFASGKYYKFPKGEWFRSAARKRGPGTESAGGGYTVTTDTYSADVWALHKDVDDQTRAQSDPQINLDAGAAQWITQQMLITREVEWATAYFTTGIWGTDKVAGTDFVAWDDYVSSDPVKDLKDSRRTIMSQTGFMPNTLVVGQAVHDALTLHPLIRDQFKYTSSESITPDVLRRVFEVDRYLIANSVRNTGLEGGTDSFGFIHGKHALLAYAAPAPALNAPSAGYTFHWNGYLGAAAGAPQISSFRLDAIKSDRVEGEMAFGQKVVATDLAHFFSAAVS